MRACIQCLFCLPWQMYVVCVARQCVLWVQVCCSYQRQSTIIQHPLQMVDSEWAWGEGIFRTACVFWDASWIAVSIERALSASLV